MDRKRLTVSAAVAGARHTGAPQGSDQPFCKRPRQDSNLRARFRNTPNPVHWVQYVHHVLSFVHYVHWVLLRPLNTRDETRDGFRLGGPVEPRVPDVQLSAGSAYARIEHRGAGVPRAGAVSATEQNSKPQVNPSG